MQKLKNLWKNAKRINWIKIGLKKLIQFNRADGHSLPKLRENLEKSSMLEQPLTLLQIRNMSHENVTCCLSLCSKEQKET